jgi:DNA adenine methylase
MLYCSPLRYPGGKGKLSYFFKDVLTANDLLDGHYVEVYAGGAAVAMELLFQEFVSCVHINDLNKGIYAFWYCLLNKTDDLCRKIADTPVDIETWKKQKNIQINPNGYGILPLGFSTFFLNRTNRSGIIKGGIIGGKNQNGKWKLDARYDAKKLTKRIELIARYRSRIKLYNDDAAEFIQKIIKKVPEKSLIYLDPPYYVKGEGLYDNYYKHDDHAVLSKIISKHIKRQRWMVSYDNVPQVFELYKNFRHSVYNINYSAADRYKGAEILFFCDDLIIPKSYNPVKRVRFLKPSKSGR